MQESGEVEQTLAELKQVEAALPSVQATSSAIRPRLENAADLSSLQAAHASASAQLAAAKDVVAADTAADEATGPLAEIGLLGTDVHAMEVTATRAVGGLDLQSAAAQARAIKDVVAGATTLGLIRVAGSLLVVGVLVLLVSVVLRRRRSASRVPLPAAPEPAPDATLSSDAQPTPTAYSEQRPDNAA